jgi:hypothetical protein
MVDMTRPLPEMSSAAQARFWRRVVTLLVAREPGREARVRLDELLTAPDLGVVIDGGEVRLVAGDER